MKKTLLLTLFAGTLSLQTFSQDCTQIEKKFDEFDEETQYRPTGTHNAKLLCYQKENKNTYYISLTTTGSTLSTGEKGAYLILANGEKMMKPDEEIDVEYNSAHTYGTKDYEYSAFFRLTKEEFEKLTTQPVRKFKLYIYEQDLTKEQQDEQILLANCLKNVTKN